MFTVTDEDQKLRAEGQVWRERCASNLKQDAGQFKYQERSGGDADREDAILSNSLGAILQERTALLRRIYREDRRPGYPMVWVLVSQRAVEDAMAKTRMKVRNERNIHKLIHRFISEDFEVGQLSLDYAGDGRGLTKPGHRYNQFPVDHPAAALIFTQPAVGEIAAVSALSPTARLFISLLANMYTDT